MSVLLKHRHSEISPDPTPLGHPDTRPEGLARTQELGSRPRGPQVGPHPGLAPPLADTTNARPGRQCSCDPESACSAGDLGSIPGSGRGPGAGHATPLQYSCPEKPRGQRSLVGYSPRGRKESGTTERLSTHPGRVVPAHHPDPPPAYSDPSGSPTPRLWGFHTDDRRERDTGRSQSCRPLGCGLPQRGWGAVAELVDGGSVGARGAACPVSGWVCRAGLRPAWVQIPPVPPCPCIPGPSESA